MGTALDTIRLGLFSAGVVREQRTSAGEHSGRLLDGLVSRHIRANPTITFRDPCARGCLTGGMILNGQI